MSRFPLIVGLLGLFALSAHAGGGSETKVQASAKASPIGADGKQTVMITLEVEKGWYIYANPLKANTDVLEGVETRVSLKSKGKIESSLKFPVGKQKVEGKYNYNIYEGTVVIEAELRRAAGDAEPLQATIEVNACRKNECLLPGKLTIPVK